MEFARRTFLGMMLAAATNPAFAKSDTLSFGPPAKFSFDDLVNKARKMARETYAPRVLPPWTGKILDEINYDQQADINNPPNKGLFADTKSPITFFHLGLYARKPVTINVLENGIARELVYSPAFFNHKTTNPASRMPNDAGFAGFRIMNAEISGESGDWCVFLGASYSRCAGDGRQYGSSARAVAIDTAPSNPDKKEEFPDFTSFWIEPLENESGRVMALLDGPSITGAYIFTISHHPKTKMHVDCVLFPRRKVDRFGVAVPTSMYWYSKTNRWEGQDMRPEVHDSDGLSMHTGSGEIIWRPLNNPPCAMANAFGDNNPKGFGLIQRERHFEAYEDDIGLQSRPNVWIQPTTDWGPGAVQLIELPTAEEYMDNIVCMWTPARAPEPGDELKFSYDIFWSVEEDRSKNLAYCTATRLNKASHVPAKTRKIGEASILQSITVEFDGPALEGLNPLEAEMVISVSRGYVPTRPEALEYGVWPQADGSTNKWHAVFTVHSDGDAPIDIRLFLRHGGKTLTETWLYQLHPNQYLSPLRG